MLAVDFVSPILVGASNIRVGTPGSGTVSANGALTLTTAMPTTFSEGAYFYFPSGAVFAGSAAGLYWVVMSSTTAGTIYNNVYDPNTMKPPLAPASPVAISAAGPGVYTANTSQFTAIMFPPIAADFMGAQWQVLWNCEYTYSIVAGNKTVSPAGSGVAFATMIKTTTGGHDSLTGRTRFVTATRANNYVSSEGAASSATSHTYVTCNTAIEQPLRVNLTCDTATEFLILQSVVFQLLPPYGA